MAAGGATLYPGTVGVSGRFNAKQALLTFLGLYPGELSMPQLADFIRTAVRGHMVEFSIGREKHSRPANAQRDEHIHVLALATVTGVQHPTGGCGC